MRGPGALVSFELAGGHEAARKVMAGLHHITPAVSLGSADSLIQHPASLTHRVMDPEAREACGISEGLLRLSVGLEGVEDLWLDLEVALAAAAVPAELASVA